jgi:hypothetical protein
MNELPKIALARLRAKADAPKPAGAPVGPPAIGGEAHPDANMIAAFAEKTLTDRERTQVLNHLSQCADCREVAAFIVPADAVVEESARMKAGMRWNAWPMLRWGALAGVMGILAIVVVSHPDMWRNNQQIAKVTPPPAPAGNVARAPVAVAPLPSTPPPAKDAELDARLRTRGSASETAQLKKESGPQQDQLKSDRVALLQAKQHTTMMASVRPPAELREENAPAEGMSRRESLGDDARSAGVAAPPLSSPAAPAGEPTTVSGEAGKVTAESSSPATPHNITQSVTATAEAETSRVTSPSATATGGNPGAAPRPASAAKTAPRAAAQANVQGLAQTSKFGIGAFSKEFKLKGGPSADLWSVSSDGNVQHSVDGAKTFRSIEVAHGVKFQSVAANGSDVWAGGTGGALYHSIDAGATWARIAISFEGNAMTETISAIQLHDPQHLTVITTSGSAWVSEDGGQHWQKQP